MSPRRFLVVLLVLLALDGLSHAPDARANCRTHRCWHRVHVARVTAWLWRHYRAHPMPRCTWVNESGPVARYAEYGRNRYRVRNSQSTAGGKYQILDGTWYAFGGGRYRDSHPAAVAPPLEQEKIARRILRGQGIGAWMGCS